MLTDKFFFRMQKKGMLNKLDGKFRPGLTIIYICFAKITIKNFKNLTQNQTPLTPLKITRKLFTPQEIFTSQNNKYYIMKKQRITTNLMARIPQTKTPYSELYRYSTNKLHNPVPVFSNPSVSK